MSDKNERLVKVTIEYDGDVKNLACDGVMVATAYNDEPGYDLALVGSLSPLDLLRGGLMIAEKRHLAE